LKKCDKTDIRNVTHFLETSANHWFLSCAELCIMESGCAEDSSRDLWSEPEHLDGGASVLHMGVTLFGRRNVVFQQGEGLRSDTRPDFAALSCTAQSSTVLR
jgi:hypothetical protein